MRRSLGGMRKCLHINVCCLQLVSMITMRLLVVIVLLSGVLAIGNSDGPVDESLVTEPSAVQGVVKDDSEEKNTLVAEKGMFVNVSLTSGKTFSGTSIKDSRIQYEEDTAAPNQPDAELKVPLSTVEKEKALKENRKYLITQNGEKVEENQLPLTKVETVKPMTYESKNEVSSSSQDEEVKLPNQVNEEKTIVKLQTKEAWVIDPSIQDWEEVEQPTLDEEKVSKSDNESSLNEDSEEVPLDEEESLMKDGEGVNYPWSQDEEAAKALFEALWEDVNVEANASNFAVEPEVDQQNVTNGPMNEDDMEIASVPHMGDNEKLQDDSYTMFVFEEDDDEDAKSQSQEEYDNANTWLIFEEDEDAEDATSESWVEHGEMTWLAIDDEGDSNESIMGNSTVLISQRQDDADIDGVLVNLEEDDNDDAAPKSPVGFDEILYPDRNNGIKTGYDFSDQKNRNSPKEFLSRHFFAYLVATAILIIIFYAVYHYNGKIIAYVMEKRSKGGWRASDTNYQSLDNKV
ncbi:uncharacterized protein LOC144791924 [Lissotriton helveticus]